MSHSHYLFYVDGIARCGCRAHFGLTPTQADAELPDPPPTPTDLTSEIERRRRDLRNIAARKARQRNRQAGGAS